MLKLIFIALLLLIIFFIYNKKERFSTNNKKVALCFLIYDKINHEEIWYKWLKNINKSKYNIYIHYKEDKKLKYFNDYKLKNCIETCWGCLSVVQAQNLILEEALKDKNNHHFIWLSQSCLPFKSFNYIYKNLDTTKSYFNKFPDSQVFPRGDNLLKYFERKNIKKASMPAIINRKHAILFINNNSTINKNFKNVDNVDEFVYLTLIYHHNLQNEIVEENYISYDSKIFTSWPDMNNYKKFDKSILTKETPNSYSYICPEELEYLVKSKSLFGRKFDENCGGLENLLKMISE